MAADEVTRRARREIDLAAQLYVHAGPPWNREVAAWSLHAARLFFDQVDERLAEAQEEARESVTPDPEHERAMGRL